MERLVDLIPHRAPWLLVDRVIARSDDSVEAEKRLCAGDPLLAPDGLPELLALEALAQTAALGALLRFEVEARVGDRVIARGEMTFAVTVAP